MSGGARTTGAVRKPAKKTVKKTVKKNGKTRRKKKVVAKKRTTRRRAQPRRKTAPKPAVPPGPAPRAGKNIVLCSDGTGSSGGKARGTNVWAVFRALDRSHPGVSQVAFYDDGVGTQKFIVWRVLGAAFGFGVNRNIRELYTALVRNYEPGDRIYLFGFSRGAYTVRALAGLLAIRGILDRRQFPTAEELNAAVWRTFREFRRVFRRRVPSWLPASGKVNAMFKRRTAARTLAAPPSDTFGVPIEFMGVWDTVDAVGMPVDELADVVETVWPFRFPDTELSGCVRRACHALSVDDERRTFHPVLWDEGNETTDRIEQVWFAGVHTNVGGGYPKDQMAYVTLDWMLRRAAQAGLEFDPELVKHIRAEADVNGKLYDSRAGFASYYRYAPRDIAKMCREANFRRRRIHASVFDRISRATLDYAPAWIPDDGGEVVDTAGGNVQEVEERLRKTAAERERGMKAARAFVAPRKLLHFVFVVYSLVLAGLAVQAHWTGATPPAAPSAWGKPFLWLRAVLPDMLAPALNRAAEYWYCAWGLAALLAVLLAVKNAVERAARRAALDAWAPFRNGKQPPDGDGTGTAPTT